MFSLFKPRVDRKKNALYVAFVKIGRGSNTEMPATFTEAFVPVFSVAENYEIALKAAVSKLRAQGYEFLDIKGPVQELDPTRWSSYVQATWPEFESVLPDQEWVLASAAKEPVFFGPFISYAGA
jgi:hypothetical protein